MRDLIIFSVVFFALPFCFARPYIGILMFSWVSYMNPHRLAWSVAYDFEFAQIIAAVTLLGFIYYGIKSGKLLYIPRTRETTLLILIWIMFLITTYTAIYPEDAWPEFQRISKILVITFLTMSVIDDMKKLKYLMVVIALSIGFYGFKGGIFSILSGGSSMVYGPPGSSLDDNNALGLALVIVLPMLYFLAKDEQHPWFRRCLYLTFALSLIALLFTYSRGALLGLLTILLYLVAGMKLKNKAIIAGLVFICIPILFNNLPDKWIDKMESIAGYEHDSSANKRINAWIAAWNLALERPLTGGGFQIIDYGDIIVQYNPQGSEEDVGVHSVYMEIIGENGFITFIIYILLLLFSIASARKVKNYARKLNNMTLVYYSAAFEAALYGFMASGTFLEKATFDLILHVIAMTIVLKTLTRQEFSDESGLPKTRSYSYLQATADR